MDLKPELLLATTTTTLSRIRGFTVTVLLHLKDRLLTVSDLVELTGKYYEYVYMYLIRMRNYGLAEKKDSYWKITPLGVYFLNHMDEISKCRRKAKQKLNRNITET